MMRVMLSLVGAGAVACAGACHPTPTPEVIATCALGDVTPPSPDWTRTKAQFASFTLALPRELLQFHRLSSADAGRRGIRRGGAVLPGETWRSQSVREYVPSTDSTEYEIGYTLGGPGDVRRLDELPYRTAEYDNVEACHTVLSGRQATVATYEITAYDPRRTPVGSGAGAQTGTRYAILIYVEDPKTHDVVVLHGYGIGQWGRQRVMSVLSSAQFRDGASAGANGD